LETSGADSQGDGLVLGALARQLAGGPAARGSFRQIPVSLPDEESPSATKRALLTAGLSFPPNSFVLEIDSDRGRCSCTS
jgi:hypothetical protein